MDQIMSIMHIYFQDTTWCTLISVIKEKRKEKEKKKKQKENEKESLKRKNYDVVC